MESMEEFVAHVTESMGAPRHSATLDTHEFLRRRVPARSLDQQAPTIHPSAIVHPSAELGRRVRVGPYSIVGPDVVLEDGVCLMAHVVVDGSTRVGRDTTVYPFACLGGEPQDKKHRVFLDQQDPPLPPSLASALVIGRNCVIREHATIHGSTAYSPDSPTTVGDDCWVLCGAHIGHDVRVGNRVVISNNVCVAGHVHIGDFAIIGGQVGLKQHVKVGCLTDWSSAIAPSWPGSTSSGCGAHASRGTTSSLCYACTVICSARARRAVRRVLPRRLSASA